MLEDYNKIIESLNIKFIRSRQWEVVKPVTIKAFYDVQNTMILVNSGCVTVGTGSEMEKAHTGDIIFIPGGRSCPLTFGYGEAPMLSNDEFMEQRDKYLSATIRPQNTTEYTYFVSVTFDVKAFDSVSFFNSLDLPPFLIRNNRKLAEEIRHVNDENTGENPGKTRAIILLTELMVITMFRHILKNRMFVEKLATNTNYFKDPRLIDIFNYIKENLSGDLSNKALANVANVSEDYVGQYFKSLTGINPQDYIEYQRMERAVDLLRTSKKSIRVIGHEVGYKDTAYFCRRFKMMFGIPAGKMRRRETMIEM